MTMLAFFRMIMYFRNINCIFTKEERRRSTDRWSAFFVRRKVLRAFLRDKKAVSGETADGILFRERMEKL